MKMKKNGLRGAFVPPRSVTEYESGTKFSGTFLSIILVQLLLCNVTITTQYNRILRKIQFEKQERVGAFASAQCEPSRT